MFATKIKNKKGFTLVELLLVVAIISLLSSIVLANVRDARQKARYSAAMSQMNELSNEAQLFYVSNNYSFRNPIGWFIELPFGQESNQGHFHGYGVACDEQGTFDYLFKKTKNEMWNRVGNIDPIFNQFVMYFHVYPKDDGYINEKVHCSMTADGQKYRFAIQVGGLGINGRMFDGSGNYTSGEIQSICIDHTGFVGPLSIIPEEFITFGENPNATCAKQW
jgi:type IV pilus assembly protein PilA